jgi:undecaprenyl-diphosphatase
MIILNVTMDSFIIFGAKYLFLLVPFLWVVAWYQASIRYKRELPLSALAAIVIAAIADKIAGKLYYDPRPFVNSHVTPLITHAADNGFPSEHTLFSAAIAGSLIFYRPKLGAAALAVALIVGICRVAAHVHSPIDIAGGLLIGLAAGYGGSYLVSRLLRSRVGTKNG